MGKEFLEYLKSYFTINLKDYPNIGIDFEINVLLLVLFVFLSISFYFYHLYSHSVSTTVKQLMRNEAYDEKSAKKLAELNLDGKRTVKRMLKKDNFLTKIVKRVGQIEYSYEEYKSLLKEKKIKKEKIDFEEDRFYIKDKNNSEVLKIYNAEESSLFRTVLVSLFLFLAFVCLYFSMPEILNFLDNFIGRIKIK